MDTIEVMFFWTLIAILVFLITSNAMWSGRD